MVLRHIIGNAEDAGGVGVTVRTSQSATQVYIAVIDEGDGMTPDFVREHLFRPFDSTKSSRGMGIGAYQTREFARAAGGDVEVVSSPGQGTTFTIVLPLAGVAEQGELTETQAVGGT